MFSRNELIWGKENQQLLKEKHVVIFGVGAVGGYAAEMLTRCGIGKITLVDFDEIDRSNLNRQIIALHSNIGKKKTVEFEKRLKDINPEIQISVFNDFYNEKLNDEIFFEKVDAVVDAIDTMKSKIQLLKYCRVNNIFVVSAMGAGNKLDPTQLVVKGISETGKIKNAFAANIIRILAREGITDGITAVYSEENLKPLEKIQKREEVTLKSGEVVTFDKITPGSISFVTAVSGSYCAYAVIKNFLT